MTLNGKIHKLDEPITIIDFVRNFKLNRNVVVIQVNGQTIPRSNYDTVMIDDADVVQMTFVVSGG
jgi:thiamine biosynthesis protein ThiS